MEEERECRLIPSSCRPVLSDVPTARRGTGGGRPVLALRCTWGEWNHTKVIMLSVRCALIRKHTGQRSVLVRHPKGNNYLGAC